MPARQIRGRPRRRGRRGRRRRWHVLRRGPLQQPPTERERVGERRRARRADPVVREAELAEPGVDENSTSTSATNPSSPIALPRALPARTRSPHGVGRAARACASVVAPASLIGSRQPQLGERGRPPTAAANAAMPASPSNSTRVNGEVVRARPRGRARARVAGVADLVLLRRERARWRCRDDGGGAAVGVGEPVEGQVDRRQPRGAAADDRARGGASTSSRPLTRQRSASSRQSSALPTRFCSASRSLSSSGTLASNSAAASSSPARLGGGGGGARRRSAGSRCGRAAAGLSAAGAASGGVIVPTERLVVVRRAPPSCISGRSVLADLGTRAAEAVEQLDRAAHVQRPDAFERLGAERPRERAARRRLDENGARVATGADARSARGRQ